MPTKKRTVARQAAQREPLRKLRDELIDQLVKWQMTANDVHDLMLSLNKAVIERTMQAEMKPQLGYGAGQPNVRNDVM